MIRRGSTLKQLMVMSMGVVMAAVGAAQAGLPGDCIALARIESVDKMAKDVGDLMSEVQSAMNPQMLTMALGQNVGNPMLAGVDREKAWWAVVMDPTQYEAKPVFVAPITAREQFQGALAAMMTEGETVDGVTTFTAANGQATMVGFCEGHAIVGKSKLACQAVLELWQSGAIEAGLLTLRPTGSLFVATIDIGKTWAIYQPVVTGAIQTFKMMANQGLQQAAQGQAGRTDADRARAVIEAEIGWFLATAEQLEQVSLALTVGKQGVSLATESTFKENTPLAGFLSAQKPRELGLMKYLPADAVVAGGARLDGTDHFMAWYLGFMRTIAGADEEARIAVDGPLRSWAESWAGEAAFALVPPTEGGGCIEGVYILDLADAATVEQALFAMMDDTEVMKQLNVGMGRNAEIKFEKNVATYKGKSIHRATSTFDLASMPAPQAELIRRIFTDGSFVNEIAIVDDKLAMAFQGWARERLEHLIDTLPGDGGDFLDSPLLRRTFATVPKDQSLIGFVSIGDVLEWVQGIAPIRIPATTYDSVAGIGVTARLSGRQVRTNLIVPMAEILALRNVLIVPKQSTAVQP